MNILIRKLIIFLSFCLLAITAGSTSLYAEDIEIYATSPTANVLFVIDVSGSMNEYVSGSSGPKRLDVLKSAFSTVLGRTWDNLNVGILDYGDWASGGVDLPVNNINQSTTAISVEPFANTIPGETYSDLLIRTVNAYQPRSSSARTPTVEALYEAALYFRGDNPYAGDADVPHTGWDDDVNDSEYVGGHWRSMGLRTYSGGSLTTAAAHECLNPPKPSGAPNYPLCSNPYPGSCYNVAARSGSWQSCTGGYTCTQYDATGTECITSTCNGYTTKYYSYPAFELCYESEARISGSNYVSPITSQCDNNFIVLLSDGAPSEDEGTVKDRIADLYSSTYNCGDLSTDFSTTFTNSSIIDKGECGPDLTKYLRDNNQVTGVNNSFVTTHTVGFALGGGASEAKDYLELLAQEGGGNFYNASTDPGSLADQLEALLTSLEAKPRTISTPITTIDLGNPLTTRQELYYTQFAAKKTPRWPGNVKGYYLGPKSTIAVPADKTIAIRDLDEEIAIDADGDFIDSSRSFWTTGDDGGDVTLGGFAANLNPATRTLHTDNGAANPTFMSLSTTSFDEGDLALFNLASSGNATTDHASVDELVNWARGIDVDDENNNGSTIDARAEAGDPLHSVPQVAQYSSGPARVLYTMTNEGYIHAIDVETNSTSGTGGDEIFAYMPRDLLANLDVLRRNSGTQKVYGLDGPLALHQPDGVLDTAGDKYLYFGMRRGGKNYYSLDVSDTSSPSLRWIIRGGTSGDFAELAQTWSRPTPAKVYINSTTTKDVLIFGGGYDVDQDNNLQRAADDEGRAVFIVDASDGSLIWSAGYDTTNFTYDLGLTNSIPGGIAVIDLDADGIHDRLYFGDTGGRLWRIDLDQTIANSTGYQLADLAQDSSNAHNRRFYTEPSVTRLTNGKLGITIGSGYRAHPLNSEILERTYMIYDQYAAKGNLPPSTPAVKIDGTGANAVENITSNFNFNPNAPSANANGWKIEWPAGNKVMADIDVVQGLLRFSVYEPPSVSSACAGDIGRSAQLVLNINGRPIGQPDSFYTTSGNTVLDSASYINNTLWGGVGMYSDGYGMGTVEGGINGQPDTSGPLKTRFWLNLDTLKY